MVVAGSGTRHRDTQARWVPICQHPKVLSLPGGKGNEIMFCHPCLEMAHRQQDRALSAGLLQLSSYHHSRFPGNPAPRCLCAAYLLLPCGIHWLRPTTCLLPFTFMHSAHKWLCSRTFFVEGRQEAGLGGSLVNQAAEVLQHAAHTFLAFHIASAAVHCRDDLRGPRQPNFGFCGCAAR